jgi:hypothetical protein
MRHSGIRGTSSEERHASHVQQGGIRHPLEGCCWVTLW